MPELSEPVDRATQWADANRKALHFMLGAQRMMLEEAAFTACTMLDRARSESHLFGEFAAKFAEAHSVRDLNAMARECGKHQLEFVRRECDRMLRHGERLIDATSALMSNRS
ncbi:MAG: hypothetical protein J0H42_19680 [Rhizobiales bacterium]|nr:hypothetical protein [Hyphomicrobiales bacterium]